MQQCIDRKKKNVHTINWRIYISVNSSSVIIFIIVDRSENLLTAGWKVNQLHFFLSQPPLLVHFLAIDFNRESFANKLSCCNDAKTNTLAHAFALSGHDRCAVDLRLIEANAKQNQSRCRWSMCWAKFLCKNNKQRNRSVSIRRRQRRQKETITQHPFTVLYNCAARKKEKWCNAKLS